LEDNKFQAQPRERNTSPNQQPSINHEEALQILENLKKAQNDEMLAILEEEQNRENEREIQINDIQDPLERKKLEKIFAMERAKAHQRIQKIAE
jgi:hypothetical protein